MSFKNIPNGSRMATSIPRVTRAFRIENVTTRKPEII
jgi:hypothetical protein